MPCPYMEGCCASVQSWRGEGGFCCGAELELGAGTCVVSGFASGAGSGAQFAEAGFGEEAAFGAEAELGEGVAFGGIGAFVPEAEFGTGAALGGEAAFGAGAELELGAMAEPAGEDADEATGGQAAGADGCGFGEFAALGAGLAPRSSSVEACSRMRRA